VKISLLFLGLCAFVPCAFAAPADSVNSPEPGTIVMLATGLAGIGFAAWRRNRSK
jgi:PEP-CTERM motif